MIQELRSRKFPYAELHALDDERNLGRSVRDEEGARDDLKAEDVAAFDFSRVDLALFCGRAALAERYAEAAALQAWVIDGSPAFRIREDVPLVAADVNPGALEGIGATGLIALPGSASVALATALAPLHALAGLKRVEVVTYHAVSGGGRASRGRACGRDGCDAERQAAPGAGLRPSDRLQRHSRKSIASTSRGCRGRNAGCGRKRGASSGCPSCAINATAVRVPVFFGHSLAVHAAFERPIPVDAALEVLQRGNGISVIENTSTAEFPTPATLAMAPDRVYLGRVRADATRDRALNFWVVADNVRKCAAHNAVSAAQILVNSAR